MKLKPYSDEVIYRLTCQILELKQYALSLYHDSILLVSLRQHKESSVEPFCSG